MRDITIALWLFCLLFTTSLGCSSMPRRTATEAGGSVANVDICALAANPSAYKEQQVRVTASVTPFKEGIGLSGPACREKFVDLSIDFDENLPGFAELQKALRGGGLPGHLVVVTIQGTFTPDHFDTYKQQRRPVIVAQRVENVYQPLEAEAH